jgi:hypothetical protein
MWCIDLPWYTVMLLEEEEDKEIGFELRSME